MIEVKNLTRKYADNYAVKDISFTIEDGRIYGFLGPNGAGKSTTMNIITGCLAATEGKVIVNGHDIFEEPIAAKKCIGYLPEIPPLYPDMTPREYLTFVGSAKGLKKAELKESIASVMEKTGVTEVADRLIKHLSKGFKQRVGIAQAILGNPAIIILDEPTVGLDPKQIVEIRTLIKELGSQHTVILSSHILPEVSEVCDEILIISEGKIVASDTADNLVKKFNPSTVYELVIKSDVETAANVLAELEAVSKIEVDEPAEDGTCKLYVHTESENDIRELIAETLMSNSVLCLSMNITRASLEDIFLEVTNSDIAALLDKAGNEPASSGEEGETEAEAEPTVEAEPDAAPEADEATTEKADGEEEQA